jgi:hypothetical protein
VFGLDGLMFGEDGDDGTLAHAQERLRELEPSLQIESE